MESEESGRGQGWTSSGESTEQAKETSSKESCRGEQEVGS